MNVTSLKCPKLFWVYDLFERYISLINLSLDCDDFDNESKGYFFPETGKKKEEEEALACIRFGIVYHS
jgi:hypothetical protein